MKYPVYLSFIVLVATILAGCRAPDQSSSATLQTPASAASDLSRLFAEYHEERLKLYPIEATFAGDDRYNDQLPNDLTEEFHAREKAFFKKYLQAVQQIDRASLTAEDQLSCDILQWE